MSASSKKIRDKERRTLDPHVTRVFIAHGTTTVLTKDTIGVSEFKRNPLKALREAVEAQVAVLSHNRLIGYFVAPDVFAQLHEALERLEDLQDALLSEQRWQEQKKRVIDVDVDKLGKL